MTSLVRLQQRFMDALFADAAPAEHGLGLYRRAVLANLHAALAATYPVVERLVGPAFFREAAGRFALASPSRAGDLDLFGADFAAFLAAYPFARPLEYLGDVARLEWAVHESAVAADAAGLDLEALVAIPEARQGEIRFRLHPSVRLLQSPHPVVALWEANQRGRDGTPERTEGPDAVLVWREALEVRVLRIEPPEWAFLEALAGGATLERAVAAMPPAAAAAFLAPALLRYASGGVIAGFVAPPGAA
jgi:hypothetical protein